MNTTAQPEVIAKEVLERMHKYFDLTGRALKKVKAGKEQKINWNAAGDDFLQMAQCYYDDARKFYVDGKVVLALCALNYAHGWLDAGARLGLFDVGGDDVLFTVDGPRKP
ncbi:MAG TPA: DUF357 domain-containing protein [Candidatus Nanoarchaeia archaeon]|nr:DUF357 domain-containing protein [Candidatus Nanoarchaeia archaeon]